nr:response regulator [Alteraurantiacibacter buctensis]
MDGRDGVEIVVEDEGTGMTAEAIEKAFEPFFTTKEVGRGTGLGLSQVHGFIKAAGGTVSIASEIGSGTHIHLLLPRADRETAAIGNTTEGPGADLTGKKVLLVEDDPALNELIGQMLEERGCKASSARSGSDGLHMIRSESFDIVLSDMVMPGPLGGLNLAREARKQHPDLPIVLMTGFSEAARAAVSEGFPLLRKPFRVPEMEKAFTPLLRMGK